MKLVLLALADVKAASDTVNSRAGGHLGSVWLSSSPVD